MPDSQYKSAYGTYLGDYGTPRNPNFLVNDPKELEAMIHQRNQSLYGGFSTDIRESLGSAGLLSSGALPEALAGAQIRIGQQTSGDINQLYLQELERKRQFDANRALQLLSGDMQKGQQDIQNKQDFLGQIAGTAGTIGKAALGVAFPPAGLALGGGDILQQLLQGQQQQQIPGDYQDFGPPRRQPNYALEGGGYYG